MSALEEIKARAEKATEGPWKDDSDGGLYMNGVGAQFMGGIEAIRNAHFAAHARTDVPKLVAALEAVLSHASAEVEDYRQRRSSMTEYDQLEAAGRADYASELSRRITEALA